MKKSTLALSLAIVAIAGCDAIGSLIPPITTPEITTSGKLSDLWLVADPPKPATKVKVPKVPALPGLTPFLKLPLLSDAGQEVPIPDEAQKNASKFGKATLLLTATNQNQFPVTVKIFIAEATPYTSDTAPATLTFGAATGSVEATASAEKDVDVKLLAGKAVRIGLGLSTEGKTTETEVDPEAKITVKSKLKIVLKLL